MATILFGAQAPDNFRRMPTGSSFAWILSTLDHQSWIIKFAARCFDKIIHIAIGSIRIHDKDTNSWIRPGLHRRDRCTESTRCGPDTLPEDKPFG